jgi:hypothetical protein
VSPHEKQETVARRLGQPECFVPLRLNLCTPFFLKFSTLSSLSDDLIAPSANSAQAEKMPEPVKVNNRNPVAAGRFTLY